MKIQNKLPKDKERIKIFYENCEKRHKYTSAVREYADKHLIKAKHDFSRAVKELEDKCWDWTVIKAYYSIFHAGNYLLLKKKGFFCKDHSCLIIALEYNGLLDNKIYKELSDLHESLADIFGFDLTFQLRKLGQYDVNEWENITEDDAKLIVHIARRFIQFVENA